MFSQVDEKNVGLGIRKTQVSVRKTIMSLLFIGFVIMDTKIFFLPSFVK